MRQLNYKNGQPAREGQLIAAMEGNREGIGILTELHGDGTGVVTPLAKRYNQTFWVPAGSTAPEKVTISECLLFEPEEIAIATKAPHGLDAPTHFTEQRTMPSLARA